MARQTYFPKGFFKLSSLGIRVLFVVRHNGISGYAYATTLGHTVSSGRDTGRSHIPERTFVVEFLFALNGIDNIVRYQLGGNS